jgi:hypothetical protein
VKGREIREERLDSESRLTTANYEHVNINFSTAPYVTLMSTSPFVVEAWNKDGAELISSTEIRYRRTMKIQVPREDGIDDMELYDVTVPGYEDTQLPFVPEDEVPERLGPLPRWLRHERKEDRRRWRQIRQLFQQIDPFIPEYFHHVPDVPQADLSAVH